MEILKTLNNVTVEDLTEDGAFVIPEGIEAFCKETFWAVSYTHLTLPTKA